MEPFAVSDVSAPWIIHWRCAGLLMKMTVGCDLAYEIENVTTFIFNVAVAQTRSHLRLDETWLIEPPIAAETTIAGLDNRYTRLMMRSGVLRPRSTCS